MTRIIKNDAIRCKGQSSIAQNDGHILCLCVGMAGTDDDDEIMIYSFISLYIHTYRISVILPNSSHVFFIKYQKIENIQTCF
jgi:hypothetical protein